MTDRERIYELVERVYDLAVTAVDKTTKLKQENNELKKRVVELENSATNTNVPTKKAKHKLRAMTNEEFCKRWYKSHLYCKSNVGYCCPLNSVINCYRQDIMDKPCKINGQYLFIEVKE